MFNCCFVVSNCSFFHCVEPTKVSIELCSPFLSGFAKRDTFVFVNPCSSVPKILRMSARTQILNSVVITASIDVIKFWNEVPMVIHPHEVMHSIRLTINNSNTVPLWFHCSDHCEHG